MAAFFLSIWIVLFPCPAGADSCFGASCHEDWHCDSEFCCGNGRCAR